METCFKILLLKFDKKLTNHCIGLTLHISASTVFEVLARFPITVKHRGVDIPAWTTRSWRCMPEG